MKIKYGLLLLTLCLAFSSVFAQQPTAEDFYNKGLEIIKTGRYKEAIPYFDKAIQLNSQYVEALLERSRARSNNQADLPGAMADLNTLLQINPQHGEAYFERAMVRSSLFMQVLKAKGTMRQEESLPYKKAIFEDVNTAINNGFRNKRVFLYRAEMFSRDFDEQTKAIEDYTAALSFDPDDSMILISRAHAKRRNDDLEGAIDDLREVVNRYDAAKENPQTDAKKLAFMKGAAIMALTNLSSTYALDEKPDLQLWAIQKSLEIQPTDLGYAALARYQKIFGELDDALANYNKAIEMTNGKRGIYFIDRGIVLYLQGKITEAEADFAKALEIDPNLKYYNVKYFLEVSKRQREQRKVKVELPR